MATLLIVAHEPLASALAQVAGHTYPECADALLALDVPAGAGGDDVQARIRSRLAGVGGDVLILADVFGATPCNAAREVARELGERARIVAGVNVPMLWRTLCYGELSLADLHARALGGASQGVMNVPVSSAPAVGPNTLRESAADDPKRRHDQQ
jgi:PTS system ascorbate-specific IIA component